MRAFEDRTKTREQKVTDSHVYNCGEPFKSSDIQRVIREPMDAVDILLDEMLNNMLLKKLPPTGKQQESPLYVRYSEAHHLAICLPWRDKS